MRRWADGLLCVARLPDTLSELLDAEVSVKLRRAGPVKAPAGLAGGVGVLLAPADVGEFGRGALVQAEGALVAAVLRRAAGRLAGFALDPPGPLRAGAAGALAAVVAAAARRTHAGAAPRVLAAGPAEALEADLARAGGEALLAVTLTVLIEHDAFDARVVLARSAALAAPGRPWGASVLAGLGPTPLGVPLVACAFRASIADIARLGAGDVIVPDRGSLALTPTQGRAQGELLGPAWLAAPAAEHGVRAQLAPDGRLVLAGVLEPLGPADAPEANMVEEGVDKAELVEAIGDVQVLVRVEIGEARMSAREWAALGQGDVVALGRRVGEAVVLRVGGVVVARGDLVAIDGEVGVRIAARLTGEGAAP